VGCVKYLKKSISVYRKFKKWKIQKKINFILWNP
jgi:hypothetical protein